MQYSEPAEWSFSGPDEESAFMHLQGSFVFVSFQEHFSETACNLSPF